MGRTQIVEDRLAFLVDDEGGVVLKTLASSVTPATIEHERVLKDEEGSKTVREVYVRSRLRSSIDVPIYVLHDVKGNDTVARALRAAACQTSGAPKSS